MRDLFESVKADLLDRRLRALVFFVGVLLLGAVAFAVLGGSSESAAPAASTAAAPGAGAATPALTSSSTPNPKGAKAETTYGSSDQHHSKPVDPFVELSSTSTTKTASSGSTGQSASTASASGSSGSSGSSSSGSSGGSSGSSGGAEPNPAPTPPVKPKTHTVYHVNVEFGPAPSTPGEAVHLTTYKHLAIGSKLPSSSHPLLVLKAATLPANVEDVGGASATFGLLSSPIVNGPGGCLPSDTQCESVKMMNGQLEELQYAEENGQVVTYLLRVIGVFKATSAG
jgi:hypothetical protein